MTLPPPRKQAKTTSVGASSALCLADASRPSAPASNPQPAEGAFDDGDGPRSLLEQIRAAPKSAPVPKPKSAPKSAAKSAPKAKAGKPKSSATPSVQASSSGAASAPASVNVKQEESAPKRPRCGGNGSRIQSMDPSLTGNMAAIMAGTDKAWSEESQQTMDALFHLNPREPDNEFKSDLNDVVRRTNSLLTKIRAKKRSAKRRSEENKATLMKEADDMEAICIYYVDFLKNIMKSEGEPGSGDQVHNQFNKLVQLNKAIFGCEIAKRVAKRLVFDDIGFQRWVQITTTTWPFIRDNMPPRCSQCFLLSADDGRLAEIDEGN